MSWHTLIIFRIYVIETKLEFVSIDNKNLQRRRKFVGKGDFPIQNSYSGQVQCLSHSRDPGTFDKYHGIETVTQQHWRDEMVILTHKYGIKP